MPIKEKKITRKKKIKDSEIQFALMTSGLVFPATASQVKEYEKKFGSTSVLLPEDLIEPDFLHKGKAKKHAGKSLKTDEDYLNYAIAAREGKLEISPEIRERMNSDRSGAESKQKRKRK